MLPWIFRASIVTGETSEHAVFRSTKYRLRLNTNTNTKQQQQAVSEKPGYETVSTRNHFMRLASWQKMFTPLHGAAIFPE
jgi:hypothetical protein